MVFQYYHVKLYHLVYQPNTKLEQFREGWGNDEIAFEVPGVNIPCVSLHRGPHINYHTHLDDFSSYSETSFNDSKNIIKNIILNLDKNYNIKVNDWNGLICLANPDINLYIEGSNISGVYQKSNIEELGFLDELMPEEIKYLKANIGKLKNFSNKFQSYLSNNFPLTSLAIFVLSSKYRNCESDVGTFATFDR